MPARHIQITGFVQGVFFRAQAKAKAEALRLAGWVRNNDDGSVEMHVEGRLNDIQAFEEWCNAGPTGARIEDVQAGDVDEEYLKTFVIQM